MAAAATTTTRPGGGCGRVYAALALSGLFFLAEIVASHVTHSLVLLIYSYQMLYNVLSLVLLVISHHAEERNLAIAATPTWDAVVRSLAQICEERTLKNTFGWARVEVLGTLVNMLFLMALCFAISVAGVQTIVHASHENTEPHYPMLLLCFGILGLSVDIVCYLVIGGSAPHAAQICMVWYAELKESGLILLQNVPHNVDIGTMQMKIMEEFPSILNVHEFHLWQLTNTHLIATVHIVFKSPSVYASVADRLNRYLHEQGITSTTVQPEFCH
ncbi:hypothetical protein V5799_004003, partial [Amblyomma americanum]